MLVDVPLSLPRLTTAQTLPRQTLRHSAPMLSLILMDVPNHSAPAACLARGCPKGPPPGRQHCSCAVALTFHAARPHLRSCAYPRGSRRHCLCRMMSAALARIDVLQLVQRGRQQRPQAPGRPALLLGAGGARAARGAAAQAWRRVRVGERQAFRRRGGAWACGRRRRASHRTPCHCHQPYNNA